MPSCRRDTGIGTVGADAATAASTDPEGTTAMIRSTIRRIVTGAVVAALPVGAVSLPHKAWAASDTSTQRLVVTQTDYFPKAGDDPSTFYGIFSLDGVCGFAHADYTQSDTETFFVAQHENGATGYKYNAVGKIDDEPWTITPVDDNGVSGSTFSGTADEVATSKGYDNGARATSVNYSFDGTATSAEGQRLHLVIKGILRTDDQGNVTRFDWGVQSCQLH